MTEFAVNYSREAAALIDAGRIEVDRFKTPDWPELYEAAARHRPVYVHFAINAGADDSRTTDWAAADALARATATPFVNLHLAPRAKDFPTRGDDAERDGSGPVTERLVRDVSAAAAFFGADRVIAENLPLGNPAEGFAPACAEPAVVRRAIESAGVGFLLDLSHARLTARHLGIDERRYVDQLPVQRLRELHLTGLGIVDGRWRDHLAFTDEDWSITRWAFDRLRAGEWPTPRLIALEYGGVGGAFGRFSEPAAIEAMVPRLYEWTRGLSEP